jgi:hypothetical protein
LSHGRDDPELKRAVETFLVEEISMPEFDPERSAQPLLAHEFVLADEDPAHVVLRLRFGRHICDARLNAETARLLGTGCLEFAARLKRRQGQRRRGRLPKAVE